MLYENIIRPHMIVLRWILVCILLHYISFYCIILYYKGTLLTDHDRVLQYIIRFPCHGIPNQVPQAEPRRRREATGRKQEA